MPKYKFKLDAVLKLREFKEDKLKQEIGAILKEIRDVEDRIDEIIKNREEVYKEQDVFMKDPSWAGMLQHFPRVIRGLTADIKNQETLKVSLQKKYEEMVVLLKRAIGEKKVIKNMKDKDYEKFKKDLNKKIENDIEELILMRKGAKNV